MIVDVELDEMGKQGVEMGMQAQQHHLQHRKQGQFQGEKKLQLSISLLKGQNG